MPITREQAQQALSDSIAADMDKNLALILEYLIDGASHGQTSAENLMSDRIKSKEEQFDSSLPKPLPETYKPTSAEGVRLISDDEWNAETKRRADLARTNTAPPPFVEADVESDV